MPKDYNGYNSFKEMMQNDPDPYIRFMHQDLPGGKWAALAICMLVIGLPMILAVCLSL
jgi:hypothetical protein